MVDVARVCVGNKSAKEIWQEKAEPFLRPNADCLEWTKSLSDRGYARLCAVIDGVAQRPYVHRLALEVKEGKPLEKDECALHSCDNPKCCNPEHLWRGTRVDNNKDRARKGRSNRRTGEENKSSRMTYAKADEIRAFFNSESISQRVAANHFGISKGLLWGIVSRGKWTRPQKGGL